MKDQWYVHGLNQVVSLAEDPGHNISVLFVERIKTGMVSIYSNDRVLVEADMFQIGYENSQSFIRVMDRLEIVAEKSSFVFGE